MIFKFKNEKSQKVTTFADLDPGDTFLVTDIDVFDPHFFDMHSVYLRLNEPEGTYVDLDSGDLCSIATSEQLWNMVVFPVIIESEVQKI